jgi:lysophospholipase L1-like esterase
MLYLAVLITALAVAAEGAVRVRAWWKFGSSSPSVRDPMIVYNPDWDLWTLRPGHEVRGSTFHITINSHGFRGDEFTINKPPRTIRIVCLGASTTFSGETSSNATTWTHLLQQQIQQDFPQVKVEVINAAVPGYVAADNLKNLKHRVLALDPDLVIYYELNNQIVRDTQQLARERGLLPAPHSPVVKAIVDHSLLANLVDKNLKIYWRGRSTETRIDSIPLSLPTQFLGELEEMRRILSERGVPMVLSTFVVKYRRDQDRATQIANADVAFYYMPWMSIDGMLHAMDVYNQAILDYAANHQMLAIDDRFVIPADAEHFVDCMHLSTRGNAVMAKRFSGALRASGLLPPIVAEVLRDPARPAANDAAH